MRKIMNGYKILDGKYEDQQTLWRSRNNFKLVLKSSVQMYEQDYSGSQERPVAGSNKHGNKISDFNKHVEILCHISDCSFSQRE
jgi:hypothetical protein